MKAVVELNNNMFNICGLRLIKIIIFISSSLLSFIIFFYAFFNSLLTFAYRCMSTSWPSVVIFILF